MRDEGLGLRQGVPYFEFVLQLLLCHFLSEFLRPINDLVLSVPQSSIWTFNFLDDGSFFKTIGSINQRCQHGALSSSRVANGYYDLPVFCLAEFFEGLLQNTRQILDISLDLPDDLLIG